MICFYWKADKFDRHLQYITGGLVILNMHPRHINYPSRFTWLLWWEVLSSYIQ